MPAKSKAGSKKKKHRNRSNTTNKKPNEASSANENRQDESTELEELLETCWECGAKLQAKLGCSKCHVALYCGRDCQRNAWKQGHRLACTPSLIDQYSQFRNSLEVVDRAHQTCELEGFELSPEIDYQTLSSLFTVPSPYAGTSIGQKIGGPSMKAFYDNLLRVSRKEWWFFKETMSLPEYMACISGQGQQNVREGSYFSFLCLFLAYDYFGCMECGTEEADLFTAQISSFVTLCSGDFGVPMPAERFMELYEEKRRTSRVSQQQMNRVRRYMSKAAADDFRKVYHKKTPEIDSLPTTSVTLPDVSGFESPFIPQV